MGLDRDQTHDRAFDLQSDSLPIALRGAVTRPGTKQKASSATKTSYTIEIVHVAKLITILTNEKEK